MANSFLSKLKNIQKNWKPLLQVMANMTKQNQSRRHFVPATNVKQSETLSPSEYPQKCPLRNKHTQRVQFSIKQNKPWKSPLDLGYSHFFN